MIRKGPGSIRAFIALLLDEATRDAVAHAIEHLRAAETGAKRAVAWVPPRNLHVTLKFLGQVPEAQVAGLAAALEPVGRASAPFALAFTGVGAFPDLDHPRILWVGLSEGGAEARALQERVEAALVPLGFPPEARPWHPHLTIGRVPDDRRWRHESAPALREAVATVALEPFGRVQADRVVLVRSDLGRSGAQYRELASVALVG